MKKMNLIVVIFGVFASSMAFAAGGGVKFSIVGAGNYGLNSDVTVETITVKQAPGYGGGLLLGFPMGNTTTFEVGGIYSVYRTTVTDSSGLLADSTGTTNAVHIPATLNFMMGRAVSLGLGGWYNVGMGDASSYSDYGAQGGLRVHFSPRVFFDGAYNMGLKDFSGTKTSGVVGLFGIRLGR